MKFIFLDETGNHPQNRNLYGICSISLDSTHYSPISKRANQLFQEAGWNMNCEFKGNYLFSSTKGDTSVSVENRIELVNKLIALNIANKYARLKTVFAWNESGDTGENHLFLLRWVLNKLLSRNSTSKPCLVFADRNNKVDRFLLKPVSEVLSDRKYCLVEDVIILKSWEATQTASCLCDLIAYLALWVCKSGSTKQVQLDLFNYYSQNAIKSRTVEKIFDNLKNIQMKEVPYKSNA